MPESKPFHTNIHTIHSTADQYLKLTPLEFKRGLAPLSASGLLGTPHQGRLGYSANPGVIAEWGDSSM